MSVKGKVGTEKGRRLKENRGESLTRSKSEKRKSQHDFYLKSA